MRRTLAPALALAAALATAPAGAATETQEQAIEQLGEVNAVALNCGYFEQVKHMKHAMLVSVPKMRTLGMIYEDATDRAYKEFVGADRACPTQRQLSRRVDAAVERLKKVFRDEAR